MHFDCIFTANYIRRPFTVTPRYKAKGLPDKENPGPAPDPMNQIN
jgi:hypothetical protein